MSTWKLPDGRVIHLFTLEELEKLPTGEKVISINGKEFTKGVDDLDGDTRGGFTAFGQELDTIMARPDPRCADCGAKHGDPSDYLCEKCRNKLCGCDAKGTMGLAPVDDVWFFGGHVDDKGIRHDPMKHANDCPALSRM